MTILELIEDLEKLTTEYGCETEVVVQHRDAGGDYDGADTDIYLYYDAELGKIIL